MQLSFKILDISWGLAIINKQQISIQRIVIAGFKIFDSTSRTRWLEETFLIPEIPQQVVLCIFFLKLENLDIS